MPNTPRLFTQAEVEQIAKDAATHAVRTFRNGALTGFVILTFGVIGAFVALEQDRDTRRVEFRNNYALQVEGGRAAGVLNCNSIYNLTEGVRGVLTIAQAATDKQYEADLISKTQHDQAKLFYRASLEGIDLPDCRQVDELISTDPTVPIPDVDPLYPSDEKK